MKQLRSKRGALRKALFPFLCCTLFALPSTAATIDVNFSTTGAGPFTFQVDTFSLLGQTGSLTLDTRSLTTAAINVADFSAGDSGFSSFSETLNLSSTLTLDGITHTLAQTAIWTITPTVDSVVAAAGPPVLFDLGANGTFLVRPSEFSVFLFFVGDHQTFATSGDFAPVPEPGTLALLGLGLLGLGLTRRRRAN